MSMWLDRPKGRTAERDPVQIELPNRIVNIDEVYIKFTDEEAPSAKFYDSHYEENSLGFLGVLPFSRMAPTVQMVEGYEDNHANMYFDLIVADDDISVSRFYIDTLKREDKREPRRKKPKTRR